MSQFSEAIKRFRAQLLAEEETTGSLLTSYYADVYLRLSVVLNQLTEELITQFEETGTISRVWLFRNQRLQVLLREIHIEMDAFADYAEQVVSWGQGQVVTIASNHSQALITAAPGPLPSRLLERPVLPVFSAPHEALREMVGRLSSGAPLRDLFETLGPEAVNKARGILNAGLAAGKNPLGVAKDLNTELQLPLVRARAIARTEMLGSYRDAALLTMEENSESLKGWRWTADAGIHTCAACLAMDGKIFPVGYPFGSHVNCRCTPVPVTKSWAELGFPGVPDRRPELPTGADWFSKQPEDKQRGLLGEAKFQAFKSGEISLGDLVGYREDEVWGPQRWERSLKDIREGNFIPPKHALGD